VSIGDPGRKSRDFRVLYGLGAAVFFGIISGNPSEPDVRGNQWQTVRAFSFGQKHFSAGRSTDAQSLISAGMSDGEAPSLF
jgi:hypothetical protein